MKRLALLAFATGLMACGGGNKTSDTTQTSNPCGDPCADPCAAGDPCGDPCAAADPCAAGDNATAIDWSTWQSWAKVNKAPFASKGHKKPWVNVYVTPQHLDAYKAAAGEMPEGFAVVKSIHEDVGGSAGPAKMLTVMTKMGSDYDPDNGNWYYAAVSADGKKIMNEGKLEACINCHSSGEDYLFANKVIGN